MPQQSPISFQVRTKNVLIVDDNEAMQKLRARVLRSRGVQVHTAKSVTWTPNVPVSHLRRRGHRPRQGS